ncbi:MAG: ribosome silencing factor [Eubacteriales bacterium]|nr:ribosome silencing factor [Eubacteriales bacterium]MDD3349484.1 ribosome silencing factor [Eubacteriales bacterium]
MTNREIALKVAEVLQEKKAKDVVVIDVAEKSAFTDYLIIASGGSERQIGSLATEIANKLAVDGIFAKNTEGTRTSGWVLVDYGDIIVNLFSIEQRSRYNLEKIWSDGTFLEIE